MEEEEVASHGDDTDLPLAQVRGGAELAGGAPGIPEKPGIGIRLNGGAAELIQNGVAKTVNLVETQGLVHRQIAADLSKCRVALPRPALRRILGRQEPCQGGVGKQAGAGGQDHEPAQDPKDDPLAFGEFYHGFQLSARRTMSPFFTGAELVVMT